MLKLLFWALVAIDALGIGLFFLLGLAAAGSSKSNPALVALLMIGVPAIPLAGAILLSLRSTSGTGRGIAVLIAAAPLLLAVSMRTIAEATMRATVNEDGEMTWFRTGPMREIEEAIMKGDSATVSRVAPTVDVNKKGAADMTLLVLALRQLEDRPHEHAAIQALLAAKADPNAVGQYEAPLSIAIQHADSAGLRPVQLLLDAGANPNARDSFGIPTWFLATGVTTPVEVLTLLLDRGADINAEAKGGETALISAATTRMWKKVLLLLERGADPSTGRAVNGMPFPYMVDGESGQPDPDGARAAVKQFLEKKRTS